MGAPGAGPGTLKAPMTASKTVESLTLPGVMTTVREAPAVAREVDLGGHPAAGPAECLPSRRLAGPSSSSPGPPLFLRSPVAC